jgi:GntR family transcriptional regulator
VAEVAPPAEVADALGLAEGDLAVLRSQVLTLDDEPADFVQSYYPAVIARGTALTVRRQITGGTPALLASLGYPPRRQVDLVSARVPTQEEYAALRLPGELPVLRTFRVVYSDDDVPVEAAIMAKAGHLYELRYDVT